MTIKQIERISHIKKKTYNNVLLVAKMIEERGYNKTEALQITLNCFEQFENGHSNILWYISKILPKEEYLKQYK